MFSTSKALTDLLFSYGVDTSQLGCSRWSPCAPRIGGDPAVIPRLWKPPSNTTRIINQGQRRQRDHFMGGWSYKCELPRSWGDGKAKPAASLLRELKEGSCSLRVEKKKRGPQRRPLKFSNHGGPCGPDARHLA